MDYNVDFCKYTMLSKVNITIDQDWDRIRKIYNHILQKRLDNSLTDNYFVPEWEATQYNLGTLGSLVYNEILSPDWGTWSGLLLDSSLGWVQQARDYFRGLNFHGVSFSVTEHSISQHIDGKIASENDLAQCKINYIVYSEDQSATTYVYNRDDPTICNSYPSDFGHAYLLDVTHPHEVHSAGHREVLQFKFFNSYDEVKSFLEKAGPVHFSST